jgi:hypothetical protein
LFVYIVCFVLFRAVKSRKLRTGPSNRYGRRRSSRSGGGGNNSSSSMMMIQSLVEKPN